MLSILKMKGQILLLLKLMTKLLLISVMQDETWKALYKEKCGFNNDHYLQWLVGYIKINSSQSKLTYMALIIMHILLYKNYLASQFRVIKVYFAMQANLSPFWKYLLVCAQCSAKLRFYRAETTPKASQGDLARHFKSPVTTLIKNKENTLSNSLSNPYLDYKRKWYDKDSSRAVTLT